MQDIGQSIQESQLPFCLTCSPAGTSELPQKLAQLPFRLTPRGTSQLPIHLNSLQTSQKPYSELPLCLTCGADNLSSELPLCLSCKKTTTTDKHLGKNEMLKEKVNAINQ